MVSESKQFKKDFGMKYAIKQTAAAILTVGLVALSSTAVKANPSIPLGSTVSVTDVGEAPSLIVYGTFPVVAGAYTGGVYAGINNLLISVNSGPSFTVQGFCIDPFHYSLPSNRADNDTAVALANAPKSPGPMSATAATELEQLWAKYFSPTMDAQDAASLQVAIWELVAETSNSGAGEPLTFQSDATTAGVVSEAAGELAWVENPANINAPTANLIAVTGSGQDYVIEVPDSGPTLLMLAGSLMALAAPTILRKQASQKA